MSINQFSFDHGYLPKEEKNHDLVWLFIAIIFGISLVVHLTIEPKQAEAEESTVATTTPSGLSDESYEILGCHGWRKGAKNIDTSNVSDVELDRHCKKYGV